MLSRRSFLVGASRAALGAAALVACRRVLALTPRERLGVVLGKRSLPTPKDIFGASLKGWWQADNPLNTRNGAFFSALKDMSASGFDLSNGNPPNQPPVGVAAINGHDCVEFDGGAHIYYLTTAGATQPAQVSPFYIFAIIKPRANVVTAVNRDWFGDVGGGSRLGYNDSNPPTQINIYAGGAAGEGQDITNGNVYAVSGQFNNALSFLNINGTKTSSGTAIGTLPINQATIGTGGGFGPTDCADGWLLECGIVSGVVTAAQDAALQAFIRDRAGV